MAGSSSQLVALSPEEKRALLAQLLRKKARQSRSFPLSFAQERLWFLDQLEPANPVYNLSAAVRLKIPINAEILQQSVNAIVQRHAILRTAFTAVDGQPMQVVTPTATLTLSVKDLRDLPATEREIRLQRVVGEDARTPFDLAHGPLLRVTLLQMRDEEHVLLVTMHHIISDGWSIEVFLREGLLLYEAFRAGQPSLLPPLPLQYADFAVWQRQWLQGEALEAQLTYWKRQLAGTPSVLALPTDRPRPAVQTFRGARYPVLLSKPLTEALTALSRQTGGTLFMTLLAAFAALLYRYTGQHDIVIGSPIANRSRAELEELIGFFVNTLALRLDLSGDPSFLELLRRAREVCLGAYAHQDLPFEKLVEELQPARNLSHNPLVQAMLVLQNTPLSTLAGVAGTLELVEVPRETAAFDLTLNLWERPEGLCGWCEYNTDLFNADTIARMMGHLALLLQDVTAQPQHPLSALSFLTKAEYHQVLIEWNATATDYSKDACLQELFEAQVERTPEALALVYEETRLSYRELNRRANQVAHYLRRLGVGPDVLVGIYMERSIEMVVGLFGILKAGGAYVPLDPEYPKERVAFMLEDARVPVLLTQEQLVAALPSCMATLVRLDSGWETIAQESEENPCRETTADNLAYVIYTSGSTGKPKGVMVPHRGICNRLLWMQETYRLSEEDRVLQKTPFSFDVSVWEFFWPLLTGASLVMARPGGHRDSAYLVEVIAEQQVSTLHFVPPMLQVFLEEPRPETCACLKRVICSGEALSFELQERFFARLSAELHNLYGPTEASVDVTFWACERESERRFVPIGRPIANTQVYILDPQLSPVPVGVPGELHIRGIGLARGYLNRPDLTAEKFIPDPFANEVGSRLYKTGDLARWLPDGTIEFLGRIDHQVKIRGIRIEPGEIETVLSQHPAVMNTVVLARDDEPDNKRLVAYVVPQSERTLTSSALRDFLKEQLPDYMVPSAFVLLEALPLSPSGKVDRQALPVPERARTDLPRDFVAPRNDLELQLAQIWEEVLGVRPIGVRDNFFELGGHSLLSVRIFALMAQRLDRTLPLTVFFQNPTIEHLATTLNSRAERPTQSVLIPLQPKSGSLRRPFFLIHGVDGSVLPYLPLASHLDHDQPFYGLQTQGLDTGQPVSVRIEDMAVHYIAALSTVQPEGPYVLGGWSMGGLVAFEMAQQLLAQGRQVALLMLLDAWIPTLTEKQDAQNRFKTLLSACFHTLGLCLDLDTPLTQLPEEVLSRLAEQARQVGLMPQNLSLSQARVLLPVLEANSQAMWHYAPRPYPGRVILFRAQGQMVDSPLSPTLGWNEWVTAGVEVHDVPGNHYTMLRPPQVAVLAQQMQTCLNQVQTSERILG